jgi:hypothetical protein
MFHVESHHNIYSQSNKRLVQHNFITFVKLIKSIHRNMFNSN